MCILLGSAAQLALVSQLFTSSCNHGSRLLRLCVKSGAYGSSLVALRAIVDVAGPTRGKFAPWGHALVLVDHTLALLIFFEHR